MPYHYGIEYGITRPHSLPRYKLPKTDDGTVSQCLRFFRYPSNMAKLHVHLQSRRDLNKTTRNLSNRSDRTLPRSSKIIQIIQIHPIYVVHSIVVRPRIRLAFGMVEICWNPIHKIGDFGDCLGLFIIGFSTLWCLANWCVSTFSWPPVFSDPGLGHPWFVWCSHVEPLIFLIFWERPHNVFEIVYFNHPSCLVIFLTNPVSMFVMFTLFDHSKLMDCNPFYFKPCFTLFFVSMLKSYPFGPLPFS